MSTIVKPWDGKPISAPGIYSGVPSSVYHGADLCAGPSISSSGLRAIFANSPMEYWIESPLNPRRIEPKEKEAYILGRAAHHLLLGEGHFGRSFAARPERLNGTAWNGNRNDCKEWLELVAAEGLQVLTPGQIETIKGMAGLLPWQEGLEDSGLANNAMVRAGALSGLVEHTIIAKDEETGIYLKSRPDILPPDSSEFNDLKSSASVDFDSLQRTISDYRYDMQAGLADLCLQQAAGRRFTSFAFIFVGKSPPHAVQIVEIKTADMEEAAVDLRVAIQTFARCLETNRWPGPGGGKRDAVFLDVSPWARTRATARRDFLAGELTI